MDIVELSCLQFGLTTMYHFLFVQLTRRSLRRAERNVTGTGTRPGLPD